MNIGEAAARSGIPAKTIRYYKSVGLLPAPLRTVSRYRVYGDSEIAILCFVKRARSLGFTLDEVAVLLALWHDRGRSRAEVRAVAHERIDQINQKIRELVALRHAPQDLATRCEGGDQPTCPILDELAGGRIEKQARQLSA